MTRFHSRLMTRANPTCCSWLVTLRLLLLLCVLIVAGIPCDAVARKHIIIAYDISGSMYRIAGKTRMSEADLDRLNSYLTQILFDGVSENVSNSQDGIILPFDSGPLYQDGDMLSYFRFATEIFDEFQRQRNVSKTGFVRKLPKTHADFRGQDTAFSKARVHIYDELYRQNEKTYWIVISDEDEDISLGDIENKELKQRLARFEREFFQPPVFQLLVNNHVTLRIREIFRYEQLPQSSDAVYIATSQNPNQPAQIVAFSKEKGSGFRSETLHLDTSDTEKADFQLERVEVQIVSENGGTLHNLEPVSLNGISPPKTFQLRLPPNLSAAKNSSNKLQLTTHYRYRGKAKKRSYLSSYTTIIDTLYLALANQPNRHVDEIIFSPEGDFYINKDPLVLQTESSTPEKFQIKDIAFSVTTQGGNELFPPKDIPMKSDILPASLKLRVDKMQQFKKRTNQITLTVNYKYDGSPRKRPIVHKYKIKTPLSPLPFVIAGIVLGLGAIGLLVRWLYGVIGSGRSRTQEITLLDMSSTGTGRSDTFTLRNGDVVHFRSSNSDSSDSSQHLFNLNCEGYLAFDGKNLMFHQPGEDGSEASSVVSNGEQHSLKSVDGEFFVQIQVEFRDGTSQPDGEEPGGDKPETDDPFGNESTASGDDSDPLNR